MPRIRLILQGAIFGLAWAASLRGFMMALAGPDSTFSFTGTFGIIIPAGVAVGALLGWAEYQRRTGARQRLLILAPLLVGIIPLAQPGAIQALLTTGDGSASIGLALFAMIGGYAVSGRGPRWTRMLAGLVILAGILAVFLAPKPYPSLSATTPYGAWFATLGSSLFVVFALACSIPMRRPEIGRDPAGRTQAAEPAEVTCVRHRVMGISSCVPCRAVAGETDSAKSPAAAAAGDQFPRVIGYVVVNAIILALGLIRSGLIGELGPALCHMPLPFRDLNPT